MKKPKKPKQPGRPRKPKEPKKPSEYIEHPRYDFLIERNIALDSILDKLSLEDVKIEEVYFDVSGYCEDVEVRLLIERPYREKVDPDLYAMYLEHYHQDLKRYPGQIKAWEKRQASYFEKMKVYEVEMSEYRNKLKAYDQYIKEAEIAQRKAQYERLGQEFGPDAEASNLNA